MKRISEKCFTVFSINTLPEKELHSTYFILLSEFSHIDQWYLILSSKPLQGESCSQHHLDPFFSFSKTPLKSHLHAGTGEISYHYHNEITLYRLENNNNSLLHYSDNKQYKLTVNIKIESFLIFKKPIIIFIKFLTVSRSIILFTYAITFT